MKGAEQVMNRKEICGLLDDRNIPYELVEHKAVYNMAELSEIPCPYPEGEAKNLLLRNRKKTEYLLLTVRGDKKVDLKAFRDEYRTGQLSFASSDELMELMNLIPGAVTPFGILNDSENRVKLYFDRDLLENPSGMAGVHPCDNTATVWLKTTDLLKVLESEGKTVISAHIPAQEENQI